MRGTAGNGGARRAKILGVFVFVLCVIAIPCAQSHAEVLDVRIKGYSDDVDDGIARDRREAEIDAKKAACERAGVGLRAITRIENFKLVENYIETECSGRILPGFTVLDVGYMVDGSYAVVLIGRIETAEQVNVQEGSDVFGEIERFLNLHVADYYNQFNVKSVSLCKTYRILRRDASIDKSIFFYVTNELIGVGECVVLFSEIVGVSALGEDVYLELANGEVQKFTLVDSGKSQVLRDMIEAAVSRYPR